MSKAVNRGDPTVDRLPPRQRWNHRYADLPPDARFVPTPFVTGCLPHLPPTGRALDIAAGAGRHVIGLARHGLRVDAVDISEHGLALAQQRWRAVTPPLPHPPQLIVADIERPWLPHAAYDVVLVSFFLHRPLFPLIKTRLRPGGWLIYESFTVEQADAPPHHPIRPHFLLAPHELKNAFADFDLLFYDEGWHHGKATAQLLARKPA